MKVQEPSFIQRQIDKYECCINKVLHLNENGHHVKMRSSIIYYNKMSIYGRSWIFIK